MSTMEKRVIDETLEPLPAQPHVGRPLSRRLLVSAAFVLAIVVVAVGAEIYTHKVSSTVLARETEGSAAPVVSVVRPQSNTNMQEIVLPGNTEAFNDTPIYARTNGYLKRWYVDIGAHVQEGQLLAEIETPEVDAQLEQARADLKNAQANEQLAQITATRWQTLLKTDAVSKQETDQAVSDLSARQAAVDSALANVHRLEQLQSFEKIYAPFSGVITVRNTDIGALIDAGSAAAPKELFHIAAVDKLRVYVSIPEVDSQVAQIGARVPLTLDEYPGQTFEATIVRDSDSIDQTARTLNVEVDINNPADRIKTGAYVQVHFKLPHDGGEKSGSIVVPANTILFRAEGLRVGVVRDGHAQLVPITIGRDFGSTVEVLSGLHPDDQVIVNPSDSLIGGTAVRIATAKNGGE